MTKTVLTTLIAIFVFGNANSQITKGNWMLSGTISFSSTNYNSDYGSHNHYYDFSIYPHVGYFFADKFAAGLNIGIDRFGTKAIGTDVYDAFTDFNAGPFVRYYLLPTNKTLNIVTEGDYMYGFFSGDRSKVTTSKNTIALFAGPVLYFNETAGIEFLIGYTSYKYAGFSGRNNTVQVGLGLQVSLEKN